MMRRNRSTRRAPSPLVVLISSGLILAFVGLVFWPRKPVKPNTNAAQKPNLHKATVQQRALQPNTQTTGRQPAQAAPTTSAGVQGFVGKINGPLPRSMRRALGREKAKFLSALSARLLIWRLDLRRDLRRGDRIRLLYKPVDEQSKYQILAMTYFSRKHGKTFRFYRFQSKERRFAAYYDRKGREIEQKLRNSPLRNYDQVTSILKMRPRHKGVDFKAPTGTKIFLPWRARVLRKNWNVRYNGKCVKVGFRRRGRMVHAIFLHLDKVSPVVKVGRTIAGGTVIGTVGNSGRSTAPHLHYQTQTPRGRVIDPFKLHALYTKSLPQSEMSAFLAQRRELDNSINNLSR